MANLFFKATNFLSSRPLTKLRNVQSLLAAPEKEAYAHWLFGNTSQSLTDIVNQRKLNLQASATVQPVYTENTVVISALTGNALITDLQDTVNQSATMCAVVKASSTGINLLLGNLPNASSTSEAGYAAFVSSGKAYMTVKPKVATGSSDGGLSSVVIDQPLNTASDFFIAISHNKQTKEVILYTQQLGVEGSLSKFYTGEYQSPAANLALGNNVYVGATTGTLTYSEAILFSKALKLEEIQQVAARSITRMAERGKTI